MCCRFCELPLIPLLTVAAAVMSVVSMSAKAWLAGYLEDGTLFLRLSPWYLCVSDCKDCRPSDPQRNTKVCFWMKDWSQSGYASLTAVQHMEYWCLGTVIMSLIPSLVACLDRKARNCPFECRRPAVVLLAVACILSVASLVTFGSNRHSGLSELSNGRYLEDVTLWPYHLRLVSSVLICLSLVLGVLHECRVRHGNYDDGSDEEKVTIVAIRDDDMMEDLTDYGDPL